MCRIFCITALDDVLRFLSSRIGFLSSMRLKDYIRQSLMCLRICWFDNFRITFDGCWTLQEIARRYRVTDKTNPQTFLSAKSFACDSVLMIFCSECEIEAFTDPLGDWNNRWVFTYTNMESYYLASGNCDANFRGNGPTWLWLSDDRGCGTAVTQSPVRIDLSNGYGDNAISLSLRMFTCISDVTFTLFDRNGVLVSTTDIPISCFAFQDYAFVLNNGVSRFEWAASSQIEGNTAIDRIEICRGSGGEMSVMIILGCGARLA